MWPLSRLRPCWESCSQKACHRSRQPWTWDNPRYFLSRWQKARTSGDKLSRHWQRVARSKLSFRLPRATRTRSSRCWRCMALRTCSSLTLLSIKGAWLLSPANLPSSKEVHLSKTGKSKLLQLMPILGLTSTTMTLHRSTKTLWWPMSKKWALWRTSSQVSATASCQASLALTAHVARRSSWREWSQRRNSRRDKSSPAVENATWEMRSVALDAPTVVSLRSSLVRKSRLLARTRHQPPTTHQWWRHQRWRRQPLARQRSSSSCET